MDFSVRNKEELKVNDIVEVTLSIDSLIPDEDFETKTVLNDDDYEHDYKISFFMDNKCIAGTEFHLEAGCYPDYLDDIEGCIKEELPERFPKVTDYDIFDVDNSGGEFKTAKVRVKAIK